MDHGTGKDDMNRRSVSMSRKVPLPEVAAMLGKLSVFAMALLAISGAGQSAIAADVDSTLMTISNYAERICGKVPLGGESRRVELTGSARAELSDLLKYLSDIGIDGSAKFADNSYISFLQNDLAEVYVSTGNCKERVSGRLEKTLLQPPPPLKAEEPKVSPVAGWVDSLLSARQAALSGVRFQVVHSQSCTKGTSGGSKRATLSAQCPAYALRTGKAVLHREAGGCYGPTETAQGATGTVSQTGRGRSACRLTVTCALSAGTVASRLADDRAVLAKATESNFELLKKTLAKIDYPHISAAPVNCY